MRTLAFIIIMLSSALAGSAFAQRAASSSFIPLTPADIAALQAKAAAGSQTAKDILSQYNTHEEKEAVAQQKTADSLSALKEKAATGDAASQNALGEAYSDGRGVLQSYSEAQKWYAKAAAQGDKDAIHNLKRMRRQEYLDYRAKVLADRRQALEDQQEAAREQAEQAQEAAAEQAAEAEAQAQANAQTAAAAQQQPTPPVPTPTTMTSSAITLTGVGAPIGSVKTALTPDQAAQLNLAKQFAAAKGH